MPLETPAGTEVRPLTIPVAMEAGEVKGVAIACQLTGTEMNYLIVNENARGAPVWVSQSEVSASHIRRRRQL
jgi:hypothetical protein